MKPVRVGLLGLGTVGGGTVNVIGRNGEEIARRAGRQIEITRAAVRSLDAPRICDTTGIDVTTDTRSVAVDPDVDVIVELMGGTELARELVLEAVGAGNMWSQPTRLSSLYTAMRSLLRRRRMASPSRSNRL